MSGWRPSNGDVTYGFLGTLIDCVNSGFNKIIFDSCILGWLATMWSVDYRVLWVLLNYRATAGILVLRQAMVNPVAVCSSGASLQIGG